MGKEIVGTSKLAGVKLVVEDSDKKTDPIMIKEKKKVMYTQRLYPEYKAMLKNLTKEVNKVSKMRITEGQILQAMITMCSSMKPEKILDEVKKGI